MKIATFFSFKGGVGRSMGAMNLAWLLADKGRKIVLIDGDLHAPGLTMSGQFEYEQGKNRGGTFHYLQAYLSAKQDEDRPHIKDYAHFQFEGNEGATLHFVPVADLTIPFDPSALPFDRLQKKEAETEFINYFKQDLESLDPDYVLIDARTGFTEIGGLFTVNLPDIVVLFSGLNQQNIEGTKWVLSHLKEKHGQAHMIVFSPVPEGEEELKEKRIAQALELVKAAAPKIQRGSIPYHPRAALKEEIFVRDWPKTFIANAYQSFKADFISLNDEDIETIIAKAYSLRLANQPEQAHEVMKKLQRRYERIESFRREILPAMLQKSILLAGQKRYTDALAEIEAVLKIKSDISMAFIIRAAIRNELGQHEEAIADYDRALRINPEMREAFVGKGVSLAKLGRHDEAIADYDQALRIKPDISEVLYNKGLSHAKIGRHEEAIEDFDRTLQIAPDMYEAFNDKGASLAALGRHEEAVTAFERTLQFKPDKAEALSNKGASLTALGRHEEAIAAYDQALRIKPDMSRTIYNRGNALYALGRYEDAVAAYDKASRFEPNMAETFYNKGNSLCELGLYEDAIANYELALRINPEKCEAFYNKGCSLAKLGRCKEAIVAYERALQIKPDKIEALISKGSCFSALGQYEEALESYEQALHFKPDSGPAFFNKACALSLANRKQEALATLARAIELDGKFAKQALADEDFKDLRGDPEFLALVKDKK